MTAAPETCLLGFTVRSPLRRLSVVESTPSRANPTFERRAPTLLYVPSSRFDSAPTVSSSTAFAGMLQPASGHEVHRLSTFQLPMPPEGGTGFTVGFPLDAYTPRRIPLTRSRDASPRPFPP